MKLIYYRHTEELFRQASGSRNNFNDSRLKLLDCGNVLVQNTHIARGRADVDLMNSFFFDERLVRRAEGQKKLFRGSCRSKATNIYSKTK